MSSETYENNILEIKLYKKEYDGEEENQIDQQNIEDQSYEERNFH